MNIKDRAALIVDAVQARRDLTVPSASPIKRIGDDARWYALLTPGQHHEPGDAKGDAWDLIQVYVYGQLRFTAHVRGDDIQVRLYDSGAWEELFIRIKLPTLPPILPGGHPRASLNISPSPR